MIYTIFFSRRSVSYQEDYTVCIYGTINSKPSAWKYIWCFTGISEVDVIDALRVYVCRETDRSADLFVKEKVNIPVEDEANAKGERMGGVLRWLLFFI